MAHLIMDHDVSGCFGTSLAPISNTLSHSDLCSVSNRKKILIHRHAIVPIVGPAVGLDVCFHVLACRCACDFHQVEHKFGDCTGLAQVRCRDVRRIKRRHDLIPVTMLGLEGVSGTAQFKPVPEKVVQHVHAVALPMLQDHDHDARWRHPGGEPFQVRQPLLMGNVVQRVRTEDQIALRSRLGGQDRKLNRLGAWDHLLELC